MSNIVYKIMEETAWRQAEHSGSYRGSSDDVRDGFIHLSFAEQIDSTAERHFRGRTGLVLVAFSAEELGTALKLEPSRGGALFPHLYGELQPRNALWVRPMPLDADGIPRVTGDPV